MSETDLSGKYWLFYFGLIVSFLLLLAGVFNLTLIKGAYFKMRAWDNKIFEQIIPAARGTIYDRKGRVLSESVYQYFKIDDKGNKLYEGLGNFDGFKFEGKNLAYELKRRYPYGESASLLTGYLGKTEKDELGEEICGRKLGAEMLVGRMGVEKEEGCLLMGKDGKRLIEVDAMGEYVRELGRAEPEAGEDLHLSIDAFWQEKIFKLVSEYEKKIVVIVSEPASGKIIALVSTPSFDANKFSYERDGEAIEVYLADGDNRPLLNRATASIYQPGSVFKIVMATAGLESGVINGQTEFEDTGVIKVGEWSYTNWLWNRGGGTDGMVNVVKGIKRSNDIFFYRLGEALGVERIDDWAKKFGLGKKTEVELTGELAGVVPDPEWKKRVKGEAWYLGNTYHLSIGQGDLLVTPLQINLMTNTVANDGKRCQMSLLADKKSECVDLKIGENNLALVKEGMKQACKSGGTAWPLFNFKTSLACKTGTAEVGDGSKDTHAWLTAFAPADNPQISITVLVERGGEGSDVAAPIVGDILKEWFDEPETVVPRYDEDALGD
jgi:penicillin-binding protein 2